MMRLVGTPPATTDAACHRGRFDWTRCDVTITECVDSRGNELIGRNPVASRTLHAGGWVSGAFCTPRVNPLSIPTVQLALSTDTIQRATTPAAS
jgi:hypothetical protein